MQCATRYHAILHAMAEIFFNDLSKRQKPKSEEYVSALQTDLRELTARITNDPPWEQYMKVHATKTKMQGRERSSDAAYRMSADKLSFLADIALHQQAGSHSMILPWKLVENASAWKIDRNVKTSDLVAAKLPDYLWIEWPDGPNGEHPAWITRTIGMLVSRLVLLDAPIDRLRAITNEPLVNEGYMIELIRALIQNICDGLPCVGYRLTIVQKDDAGYRFINSLLGNECAGTVIEMLALHNEVSERDKCKFKLTEQTWANVAVRILLLAAQEEWFSAGQTSVIADAFPLSCVTAEQNIFFCQMKGEKRQISLRPKYHTPFIPFCLKG